MSAPATPPPDQAHDASGTVTFSESRVPALQSGEYTITVEHLVANSDPTAQDPTDLAHIDHTFSATNHFAVGGPRFALNPSLVHSVFPPDGSRGEYDDVLAHVVLANATLPWQRTAGGGDTPWLALLVFHPDDGVGESSTARIGDLARDGAAGTSPEGVSAPAQAPATRAGPLPADAVSYPRLTLEPGQAWSDPCRVIDVPVEVFSAIAPAAVELPWLTHVRTLETADADDDGTFAVVVANRLPVRDADCTAHLVSLEDLAGILPTINADGSDAAAEITVDGGPLHGTPAAAVRLVSLRSWSFRPVEPTETFDGFLEHLDSGPLQRAVTAGTDGDDTDAIVANALRMGYTALDHQTRIGDRTVSWMRGPLVPFDIGDSLSVPLPDPGAVPIAGAPPEPIASADSAVRYDPATGMLDVTYAAAWQIGRLLAVQNSSFASAWYDWKRAVARKTMLSVEREFLDAALGDTAPGVATADHGLEALHAAMRLVATIVAPGLASHSGSTLVERSVSLRPRRSFVERHAAVLADAAALASIHADTEVPEATSTWLKQLGRLCGCRSTTWCPTRRCCPQSRSASSTSIRAGRRPCSRERCRSGPRRPVTPPTTRPCAPRVLAATTGPMPRTGLLVRSGVVAGWPKLRVAAYDEAGAPLEPVRVEVLSPTILLAVFDGVVTTVDLTEPPLGLHFGVRPDKDLRWITVPPGAAQGAQPGDQIVSSSPGPPPVRGDGLTVAIASYAARLGAAVDVAHANDVAGSDTPAPFTAAEFAVQLVEGVEQFRFVDSAIPGDGADGTRRKAAPR